MSCPSNHIADNCQRSSSVFSLGGSSRREDDVSDRNDVVNGDDNDNGIQSSLSFHSVDDETSSRHRMHDHIGAVLPPPFKAPLQKMIISGVEKRKNRDGVRDGRGCYHQLLHESTDGSDKHHDDDNDGSGGDDDGDEKLMENKSKLKIDATSDFVSIMKEGKNLSQYEIGEHSQGEKLSEVERAMIPISSEEEKVYGDKTTVMKHLWEDNPNKNKNQNAEETRPLHIEIDDGSDTSVEFNDETVTATTTARLDEARKLLYRSHLASQAAEVMWQFFLVIFFSRILPTSLLLVATYGLLSGFISFAFLGRIGSYLDRTGRLHSMCMVLSSQVGCVVVGTICCYVLLKILEVNSTIESTIVHREDAVENDTQVDYGLNNGTVPSLSEVVVSSTSSSSSSSVQAVHNLIIDSANKHGIHPVILISLLILVHVLGALADAFGQASTISLEKDWVVVLSHGNADWLRSTNVVMRQIDLSCKMVGPALAGWILTLLDKRNDKDGNREDDENGAGENNNNNDLQWGVVVMGLFNTASIAIEYVCAKRVYQLIPALGRKMHDDRENTDGAGCDKQDILEDNGREEDKCCTPYVCCLRERRRRCSCFAFTEIMVYLKQTISMGGIALALLYLNVISVGELMTSYLLWRGLRMDVLGAWRGIASVVGIAGTVAFKCSSSKTSLRFTALWSIAFFWLSLSVCYISLFWGDTAAKTALSMLIIGICASRVGLWTFDMSINQLMQELVPEDVRGTVGGTQHSLQAFFFMMQFILGMAFPNPEQFQVLAGFGYASVGVAFLLVLVGVFWNRHIAV